MRAITFGFATALVLAVAVGSRAEASTTICVTSGSAVQFDNAMRNWQHASDQTVYVHLEQGTYNLTASTETLDKITYYDQRYPADDLDEGNATLHLVGGFV